MGVEIITAGALDALKDMEAESVHCVVTSPPYWGLRSYGGDPGMIGLEDTFEEHLENLLTVFDEVWRVLRKDGTLWLNYGDAYAGSWGNYAPTGTGGQRAKKTERWERPAYADTARRPPASRRQNGLKPKDLMMMPARVALAMQATGWWLRSEIIWHKLNPMPESVTDRPTNAHEKVFLFSKAQRYFYDAEAVRTGAVSLDRDRETPRGRDTCGRHTLGAAIPERERRSKRPVQPQKPRHEPPRHNRSGPWHKTLDDTPRGGANLRNVWSIATAPFRETHFATFPPALIEPCIKAGTSEKGCCATCGAPWKREIETAKVPPEMRNRGGKMDYHRRDLGAGQKMQEWRDENPPQTVGWQPSCDCRQFPRSGPMPVPATVLDPFAGSGTVGLVADRLQRSAVLIEISPQYAAMAKERIEKDAGGLFAQTSISSPTPKPSNDHLGQESSHDD